MRARPLPPVVLVVGLPKAAVVDELLRGATEAGVSEVRFFVAARSVVRVDDVRAPKKLERWRRIAEEAARQSERAVVPEVHVHGGLREALAASLAPATEMPATEMPATEMPALLVALDAREGGELDEVLGRGPRARVLVLGPEGGLDSAELDEVRSRGGACARATLPVMRVETAAVVATALAALAATRVS